MLGNFHFFLFKLKILEPSQNHIAYWMLTNDTTKLEYALKYGNYPTRTMAAEALAEVGQCTSVPVLLHAINDKVQNVSIAALNTLEALGCGEDLIITITKKRLLWLKTARDNAAKKEPKTHKNHTIFRWERTSKKSFDHVKERLKRPIR